MIGMIQWGYSLICLMIFGIAGGYTVLTVSVVSRFIANRDRAREIYDCVLVLGGVIVDIGFLFLGDYEFDLVGAAEVLLYAPALAVPFSLWLFFRDKKWAYLLDALALLVLLPCFQFNRYGVIYYFLSVMYFFFRSASSAYYSYSRIRSSINRYTIKTVFDEMPSCLLFADSHDRIIYVNDAMLTLLSSFNIQSHQKSRDIEGALRAKAVEKIADNFIILYEGRSYLSLRTPLKNGETELSFHDVSEELLLNTELKFVNASLLSEEKDLTASLNELKKLARGQEKERLRSLVHDTFAEEVSFVHQILMNPSTNDLRPLKSLIREGFVDGKANGMTLEDIEEFYRLIGIHFENEGDFFSCPDKSLFLEVVHESIDNAIRHGEASSITVTSSTKDGHFFLKVSNDGKIPANLTFHNGLSHLEESLKKKGGNLTIETEPVFALIASLPLN
jgi:hypothetical protein